MVQLLLFQVIILNFQKFNGFFLNNFFIKILATQTVMLQLLHGNHQQYHGESKLKFGCCLG